MNLEGTIVEIESGSYLYGLNTEYSDRDYTGVYIPTLNEILTKTDQDHVVLESGSSGTKNTSSDVDRKFMSLWKFFQGIKKGIPDCVDLLHANTDNFIHRDPIWDRILEHKDKIYSKQMNAFSGYLRNQANRYGVRGSRLADVNKCLKMCEHVRDKSSALSEMWAFMPAGEYITQASTCLVESGTQRFFVVCDKSYQDTISFEQFEEALTKLKKKYGHRSQEAESNNGVDWKAISHALRIGYLLKSIYTTGDYCYPLEETDYILSVKCGKENISEVRNVLDTLVKTVETASELSDLPERIDIDFWDKMYLGIVTEYYGLTNESK